MSQCPTRRVRHALSLSTLFSISLSCPCPSRFCLCLANKQCRRSDIQSQTDMRRQTGPHAQKLTSSNPHPVSFGISPLLSLLTPSPFTLVVFFSVSPSPLSSTSMPPGPCSSLYCLVCGTLVRLLFRLSLPSVYCLFYLFVFFRSLCLPACLSTS